MSTVLSPKVGENRLSEMLSDEIAIETRGWAARWYAEMLIELFLSDGAKSKSEKFSTLSLGDKIKEISPYYSKSIIDDLYTIEHVGNQASHFNSEREVAEDEVSVAVNKAVRLFDLILIDELKISGLENTPNTATLLSTTLPSIRVNVLREFVNLESIDNEYEMAVLDKYLLALVKNGQREKARRLTKKLLKKSVLNDFQYKCLENKINIIHSNLDSLPVAKSIEDCKRNFEDVLASMSPDELEKNANFIRLLKIMYNSVTPSDFGEAKGNTVYLQ
ncbi:hypothetical protein NYA30BAC_00677 [Halomonas sp. NYA30]|mgnify:CR=1 FL=1|tara:strand:+ start:6335 stop:7162 length:828 start_codon:yes stop_codon:yes gene_type:complete